LKNIVKIWFLSLVILFSSCNKDDEFVDIINEYPVAEFLAKLSELKLFEGELSNLQPTEKVEIYRLSTPLFTDYAQKLRFISIPEGGSMTYDGEGLPIFPDNTILAKTFYYYFDERDPSLGKIIIETRTMIKKSGVWNVGNYVWNEDQTDAFLDDESHGLTIDWIDEFGVEKTVDYAVPTYFNCITCHQNDGVRIPIGPRIRNLNMTYNSVNQLEDYISKGLLVGAPPLSDIVVLPNWEDDIEYTLEERARAYFDVNCAHCHQPGGFYNLQFGDDFDLRFEIPFDNTNIFENRLDILSRMGSNIDGYSMPFIGTSLIHDEGLALIVEYIESMD
jgi:uncharacterized repeat protein (TIGR03806 family)